MFSKFFNGVYNRCLYFYHMVYSRIVSSRFQLQFLLKRTPFQDVRRYIWQKLGNCLGEDAYINNSIILIDSPDISPNVVLGDRVALAPNITFITSSSPNKSHLLMLSEFKDVYPKRKKIIIGNDTWIGTGTVIHPGVHIGKFCVIGAMSNVTKDIPDYSVAYGNPVRVVRSIKNEM